MIESCMLIDPTASCPNSDRPMISFNSANSMNGRPPPPISAGWPSAHRSRRFASAFSSSRASSPGASHRSISCSRGMTSLSMKSRIFARSVLSSGLISTAIPSSFVIGRAGNERRLGLPRCPELRAQLGLEDLAARVARHRLDDDHVSGLLVRRHPRAAPLHDLLGGGWSVRVVGHHYGHRDLDPLRVSPADDRDLAYAWVTVDDRLHLGAVDVLPAGDDHVLLAVDDVVEAVLVLAHEVARVEPAASERLLRRLRFVPVPLHHSRTAIDDLTDVTLCDRFHVVVDDGYLDVDDRRPDRSHLRDCVLTLEHARDRAHLGLAEGVVVGDAGEGLRHRLQH